MTCPRPLPAPDSAPGAGAPVLIASCGIGPAAAQANTRRRCLRYFRPHPPTHDPAIQTQCGRVAKRYRVSPRPAAVPARGPRTRRTTRSVLAAAHIFPGIGARSSKPSVSPPRHIARVPNRALLPTSCPVSASGQACMQRCASLRYAFRKDCARLRDAVAQRHGRSPYAGPLKPPHFLAYLLMAEDLCGLMRAFFAVHLRQHQPPAHRARGSHSRASICASGRGPGSGGLARAQVLALPYTTARRHHDFSHRPARSTPISSARRAHRVE